jgi:hypothetical protein
MDPTLGRIQGGFHELEIVAAILPAEQLKKSMPTRPRQQVGGAGAPDRGSWLHARIGTNQTDILGMPD